MAGITKEDIKQLENEAYNAGWEDARKATVTAKKPGKKKTTTALLWVIIFTFLGVLVFCLGAWTFRGSYPEQIWDGVSKMVLTAVGGTIVKSGAENYGKITHAAEYNQNYPDA